MERYSLFMDWNPYYDNDAHFPIWSITLEKSNKQSPKIFLEKKWQTDSKNSMQFIIEEQIWKIYHTDYYIIKWQ